MLIEVVGVFLLGMCTIILIAAVDQMNEESEEDKDGKKD